MDDDHFHGFNESRKVNQPQAVLHPGQTVGRFQLLEMLGHGGMGQAWKAVDPNRKDENNAGFVVLKFLPDVLRFNEDATEEFKGAYRRVQALHHEHICPLYDIGEEPGLGCFQVMQFLEGITLRTLIRKEDPQRRGLPPRQVVKLLEPVAKALDYAHRNKLIHRDIKPENIIVDPENNGVHLIDFGLAAQVRNSLSKYSKEQMGNSGTEAYMSPEQWQGKLQEANSDQWALAVVAWELLSGTLPFQGTGFQLGYTICHAPSPLLPESQSRFDAFFAKAFAKTGSDRFRSCVELIHELKREAQQSRRVEDESVTKSGDRIELVGRQLSHKRRSRSSTEQITVAKEVQREDNSPSKVEELHKTKTQKDNLLLIGGLLLFCTLVTLPFVLPQSPVPPTVLFHPTEFSAGSGVGGGAPEPFRP